jgi:hypothetical protein
MKRLLLVDDDVESPAIARARLADDELLVDRRWLGNTRVEKQSPGQTSN